jgi:hypothetical protein
MIRIGLNETAVHRHVFALHQSGFHTTGDDLLKQLLKQLFNVVQTLTKVERSETATPIVRTVGTVKYVG